MKFFMSIVASLLLMVGCGTLAEKVDPGVKKGSAIPGSLELQQTNGDGGGGF